MKKKYMSPQLSVVETECGESILTGSEIEKSGTEEHGVAEVHERELFPDDIWGN